jgi:hypothetical protein
VSGEPPPILLPPSDAPLIEAARAVLATPGLPAVALVGGLAVTARVSAAGVVHRATNDIDLVTVSRAPDPEVVELVAAAQGSPDGHHLAVEGVSVDIIPTSAVDDADLEGQEDRNRLFLVGHRWAFETAAAELLSVPGGEPLSVRVATPGGLVTAKSHAVGFPSSVRRATKHGSDLLDVLRLVDLYGADDALAHAVRDAPGDLARIVADICEREILANPVRAAHAITLAALTPTDADDVADVIGAFVEDLRR